MGAPRLRAAGPGWDGARNCGTAWDRARNCGSAGLLGTGRGTAGLQDCWGEAVASVSSSVRWRVLFGSTGMPGAIVVVKVTFLRYLPLAAAGLSLITSSRAAA